jgi:mediator of RNA polymerase II transcription subunit 23
MYKTYSRAIHINGLEQQSAPWIKEVLSNIMNKTPHTWPAHTLKFFPQILQDFYNENPGEKSFHKYFSTSCCGSAE